MKLVLALLLSTLFLSVANAAKHIGSADIESETVRYKKYWKKECDSCTNSYQCITYKCWNHKCVFDNDKSKYKCFPKHECEDCKYGYECASNKCWNGKCVLDNDKSKYKCFPKHECEDCKYDYECKSYKCFRYKCVIWGNAHAIKKCFKPIYNPHSGYKKPRRKY